MPRFPLLASSAILALLAGARGANAETLEEAFVSAYNTNPQLLAERANVSAVDEGVPQALAGWRPTVQFTGSAGWEQFENTPPTPPAAPPHETDQPKTADVNITQPIYQGGGTVAKTAAAEQQVEAERARYTALEGTIFFSTVQSYFDVLRDQATVNLNINNEQVLRRQLEATEDQFRVGSLTRTDVAQAEARLAAARASRQQAEGTLASDRANFARFVGHVPQNLVRPELHPVLPLTREEALAVAATKNPNVLAAVFTEQAARSTVVATRAQLLPSLNLVTDLNRGQETITNGRETTTGSVVFRVTMPLYEGGQIYSQTRQAEEKVAQSIGLTDDARNAAVQGATQAWETIQSARASAYSLQSTISADQVALEGVRQEQQVGARTILDVLNQQQELFSDEVSLVQAQHDLAVAEFNLAQQIGSLSAVNLGLPVKLYDARTHYDSVRDKWIGFGAKD
ncbi:MAG TPA: TolC family outer membrane protein [Stellaceae bacterium]|nr:TolC family outer membrane protein [Stellaceae bacterium]